MSWFLDRETGDVIPLNEFDRLEEDAEIREAVDAGSERHVEIPSPDPEAERSRPGHRRLGLLRSIGIGR